MKFPSLNCNLFSNSPSVKTYLNHCYNMMEENLKAAELQLSSEEMQALEDAAKA